MFCENCGVKIDEGLKFCTNCGMKIEYGSKRETTPPGNDLSRNRVHMQPGIGAGGGQHQEQPGMGTDRSRDQVQAGMGAGGRRDQARPGMGADRNQGQARPGIGADRSRDQGKSGIGAGGRRDQARPGIGSDRSRDQVQSGIGAGGRRDQTRPGIGADRSRDKARSGSAGIGNPDTPLRNSKGPKDPSAPPIDLRNIDLSGLKELLGNSKFRLGLIAGIAAAVTVIGLSAVIPNIKKPSSNGNEAGQNEFAAEESPSGGEGAGNPAGGATEENFPGGGPTGEEGAVSETPEAENNEPGTEASDEDSSGNNSGYADAGSTNTAGSGQDDFIIGDSIQTSSVEEFVKGIDYLYGKEYTVPVREYVTSEDYSEHGLNLSAVPSEYLGYYILDLDKDSVDDLLLFKLSKDHTVYVTMCIYDAVNHTLNVTDSAELITHNNCIANRSRANVSAFVIDDENGTLIGAQFLDEQQGNAVLNVVFADCNRGNSFINQWETDIEKPYTAGPAESVNKVSHHVNSFILSEDEVGSICEHKKYMAEYIPAAREVFRVETAPSMREEPEGHKTPEEETVSESDDQADVRFFAREELYEDKSDMIAEGDYYCTTKKSDNYDKNTMKYEPGKINSELIYRNEFTGIKGGTALLTSNLEVGDASDEEGMLILHDSYEDNAVRISFKYYLYHDTDYYVGGKNHYFLSLRRTYNNSRSIDTWDYPASALGEDAISNEFSFSETIDVYDMDKAGTDEEDNVFTFYRSVNPQGEVECNYRILDKKYKLEESSMEGETVEGESYEDTDSASFSNEKELLNAAMQELAGFFGEGEIKLSPISWDNKMEALQIAPNDWVASYRLFVDEGEKQEGNDSTHVTKGRFRVKAVKAIW